MAIVAKLMEYSTEVGLTSATGRERFRVHGTNGETITAQQAYSAVSRTLGTGTLAPPGLTGASLVVSSIGMARVEDAGGNVWDVDVSWGSATASGSTSNWSMSADIGGEYVDVWRTGLSYNNGTVSSLTTDIGGTKVDQNGQPVSVFVARSNLSITVAKTTSGFFGDIWSAIGTRNSAAFAGANQGQLLFTGARVQVNGDCNWSVTYNFMSDPAYHLIQRPLKDAVDGNPVLNADKQAAQVYHFQPYPNTSNFATLVGGSQQTCNS
jgi:hypothetical protein